MIEDYSNQKLNDIPLTNVQILNLSNNLIFIIPLSMSQLTKLQTLILNHNQITIFPIIHLPNLKHLEIAHNRLISSCFEGYNLQSLDISHNDFQVYEHLESLDTLTMSWFKLINLKYCLKSLNNSEIGMLLRFHKKLNFVQFVNLFSKWDNSIVIRAIQYDERAILHSICKTNYIELLHFYTPQPLFYAAQMNLKILQLFTEYIPIKSILFTIMLFWATNKLDVDLVQYLLQQGVTGMWDSRMTIIQSKINIQFKTVNGDTPLHVLFRRQCTNDIDYDKQRALTNLLKKHFDVNRKNQIKMAPIHYLLTIPSLRSFCCCDETFNYSLRFGEKKDSLMHQAAFLGYIQAVQYLNKKVSVFLLNTQNKTAKFSCSASLSLLKYIRKLELEELREQFDSRYNNLIVSAKNLEVGFHLTLNLGEDDLYKLLLNDDLILSDKLIITILLNMLEFKKYYLVKFQSQRQIKPITTINKTVLKFEPNIKEFHLKLTNLLRINRNLLLTEPKGNLKEYQIKLSKNLMTSLEPIQNNNCQLYDTLSLYQQLGIGNGGISNRTVLLDYEELQQKSIRTKLFVKQKSKEYKVNQQIQSPLPFKYKYDNFLSCRKSMSLIVTVEEEYRLKEVNKSLNKQFIL